MSIFRGKFGDEVIVEFGADVELERCLSAGAYLADELAFHDTRGDAPIIVLKFQSTDQLDSVIHELAEMRNEMWLAGMLRRFIERK